MTPTTPERWMLTDTVRAIEDAASRHGASGRAVDYMAAADACHALVRLVERLAPDLAAASREAIEHAVRAFRNLCVAWGQEQRGKSNLAKARHVEAVRLGRRQLIDNIYTLCGWKSEV